MNRASPRGDVFYRWETNRAAVWLLRQIQHLYQIEAHLRRHRAGPQWRAAGRAAQSRPIVTRMKQALLRLKARHRHLPHSLLGQALGYASAQWSSLEVFLRDDRVEIDNNLVENAIRPTALGKKTGSSSARPPRASAAPSSTPWWKAAAAADSIPTPTCATSSPACPG